MWDTVEVLPLSFWVAFAILLFGVVRSLKRLGDGTGLPALAVLFTVSAWYVGDAFYNDYALHHELIFENDILAQAWWQVAAFAFLFLVLGPKIHRSFNRPFLGRSSSVIALFQRGVDNAEFQMRLHQLFWGCVSIWLVVSAFAFVRLEGEVLHFFFPYVDHRADPWVRDRIGGGIDALLSLANYLQILIGACFGLIAALAKHKGIRFAAMVGCAIVWPFYFLGRTRNTMLAVSIPGILAWAFLRLRFPLIARVGVLAVFFAILSQWFSFVLENRMSSTMMDALKEKGFSSWNESDEDPFMIEEEEEEEKHRGLNMYEELCWINSFFRDGTISPDWGTRYFAELVNPIPRSLWPGKPVVGLDYAIARGFESSSDSGGGVLATVASGMIGQAVLSFGRFLGPPFAALLFSFWAAILTRLDLEGMRVGRIPLFGLGMLLTFNLGRDVTFLTLYSFAFGSVLIWVLDRRTR